MVWTFNAKSIRVTANIHNFLASRMTVSDQFKMLNVTMTTELVFSCYTTFGRRGSLSVKSWRDWTRFLGSFRSLKRAEMDQIKPKCQFLQKCVFPNQGCNNIPLSSIFIARLDVKLQLLRRNGLRNLLFISWRWPFSGRVAYIATSLRMSIFLIK